MMHRLGPHDADSAASPDESWRLVTPAGSIPQELSRLTALQVLWLNNNNLSGELPLPQGGRPLHGDGALFPPSIGRSRRRVCCWNFLGIFGRCVGYSELPTTSAPAQIP